jgi:hypothetical protein
MLAGRFRYAAEVGAQLKAVIDAQANRIFREHKAGTDHEPLEAEGCDCRGYLERDHFEVHAKGGLTSFENLGWLCYRHHRLKSRGWILGPRDPITRKRTLRRPQARAA